MGLDRLGSPVRSMHSEKSDVREESENSRDV